MFATSLLARRILILALTAALLGIAVLIGQAPTRAAAVTADATTTSAAHPFSAPLWFPLHTPADIGCANTACGAYKGHGYWALDFTGNIGDGVFAAGAGILHIGGLSAGCAAAGSTEERNGNWVWIDHGAGVVTRYHHLDTVTAKEGQLVTPATQIGTMGHSGDNEPCSINYLHFEVRHGGVKGVRVNPGQLNVCSVQGLVSLPKVFGATSWDDAKIHTRPRIKTLAGTTACMTPSWMSTPDQPSVKVTRSSGALLASWGSSTTDARVVLALETYKPSLKAWGGPTYATVPAGATSYSFTGLQNGRPYRVTAFLRNSAGPSRSSAAQKLIPAGLPSAPPSLRYASWTKRAYVHYGWNRPTNNGAKVTSFTTAWRCAAKGKSYSATWSTLRQGEKNTYLNIRKLTRYTRCQVKVRATNAVGAGAWTTTKTVRWGDR